MSGCPSTSVEIYQNCGGPPFGLYGYPGVTSSTPNFDDGQYAISAARNVPQGLAPGGAAAQRFKLQCEAMLRSRGIIYWRTNPGDCPAPPAPGGISNGQIAGLSGTAASGVIGGLGAVGTLSGAATLGIGTAVTLAVAGIEDIFAHHAEAVANEQATICKVAAFFNPLVKQIDAGVRNGQIDATQGVAYMKQIANQAISGLASIYQVCNAACWVTGWLKAHIDFANYFYPHIAPPEAIGPNDPGGAPDFFGTPPGGVNVSSNTYGNAAPAPPVRTLPGNMYAPAGPNSDGTTAPPITPNRLLPSGCSANCGPDYLNLGYRQTTGQEAQAADVPPSSPLCWVCFAILMGFLLLLVSL